MTHQMKLVFSAFDKIAKGAKTIELRLNDPKRQKLKVGDIIMFACVSNGKTLTAQVKGLHKFDTFEKLYNALPLERCGYEKEELLTAHYTDMERFYTKEEIARYSVLGIELKNVQVG